MPIKDEKTLIADVFDCAFYKNSDVVFTSDTLTDGSIDVKVNEKEVRGGKGNGLIATLHSGRDITVKVSDPTFKYTTLAMNLGQEIKTGAGVAYTMLQYHVVKLDTTKKVITLDKAPKTTTDLKMLVDGVALTSGTYTVTGNKVEFTGATVNEGTKVTVYPYAYASAPESQIIEISADTYATGGKLVLETLEVDTSENQKYKLLYVFENALPTGNFTINTKSERDASQTELEFKIAKPANSDKVGYILREPIV